MRRWKAAHVQLDGAIRIFCEASAALEDDVLHMGGSASGNTPLEENLETLDTELPRIAAHCKRLGDTWSRLKVVRNSSRRVVPINRLSVEILTRVFAIMVGWDSIYCNHGLHTSGVAKNWKNYAVVLSGVNAAWRRVMINTPSFWSHIDVCLTPESYHLTRYNELRLQRVGNTPRDLHIFYNSHLDNVSRQIAMIPEYLSNKPIASLNFVLPESDLIQPMSRAWLNSNTLSTLTDLDIKPLSPWLVASDGESISPSHLNEAQFYECLPRLRSLRLASAYLDWSRAKFSGLVDLELANIRPDFCPSVEQLQGVLLASPRLCVLRLSNMAIQACSSMDHGPPMKPIILRRLTFLGLGDLERPLLHLLLNLIAPGPDFSCFNVSCHLPGSEVTIQMLQTFCKRHKVSTMSLRLPSFNERQLASFLYSLTDLRTLNLSRPWLGKNDTFANILSSQPDITPPGTAPHCLKLQQLRLSWCSISDSGLRRIIGAHPIRWLRLDQCRFSQARELDTDGSSSGFISSSVPPKALLEWLNNVVPELQFNCEPNESAVAGLPWWLSSI